MRVTHTDIHDSMLLDVVFLPNTFFNLVFKYYYELYKYQFMYAFKSRNNLNTVKSSCFKYTDECCQMYIPVNFTFLSKYRLFPSI